jgi:hypothetical protein
MQAWILIVQAFHALPAVFWAGTTFVLARTGGADAERLVPAQVGALIVTILAGMGLWRLTHPAGFGLTEQGAGGRRRLRRTGCAGPTFAGASGRAITQGGKSNSRAYVSAKSGQHRARGLPSPGSDHHMHGGIAICVKHHQVRSGRNRIRRRAWRLLTVSALA